MQRNKPHEWNERACVPSARGNGPAILIGTAAAGARLERRAQHSGNRWPRGHVIGDVLRSCIGETPTLAHLGVICASISCLALRQRWAIPPSSGRNATFFFLLLVHSTAHPTLRETGRSGCALPVTSNVRQSRRAETCLIVNMRFVAPRGAVKRRVSIAARRNKPTRPMNTATHVSHSFAQDHDAAKWAFRAPRVRRV